MKLFKDKKIDKFGFCPYIKTEETILKSLMKDNDISDDYTLMFIPLAHLINTIGVSQLNLYLQSLEHIKNRIFICQHIYVDKLKFKKDDIVFTPHSSINDNFLSIPHYAVNIDTTLDNERSIMFSFLGSTSTHWTRKKIVELYEHCYDSNEHWGLDIGLSDEFKNKYINLLSISKFSICPRGTGISSVRLFESMAMGSFPVVIADNYEFPLKDIINWDKISVHIPERDIYKIPNILNDVKLDQEYLTNIYNKYFSNDKLAEVLKITLNE
jgi:hypothetical protein